MSHPPTPHFLSFDNWNFDKRNAFSGSGRSKGWIEVHVFEKIFTGSPLLSYHHFFARYLFHCLLAFLLVCTDQEPDTSLRKQPTFGDATTGFPAKWRLRNERRNSILMTRHYPDLGSASDWLNQISHAARPIRSTTQIWVVTRHQYGISALVSQTSFGGETRGNVAKCRLFSLTQAKQ